MAPQASQIGVLSFLKAVTSRFTNESARHDVALTGRRLAMTPQRRHGDTTRIEGLSAPHPWHCASETPLWRHAAADWHHHSSNHRHRPDARAEAAPRPCRGPPRSACTSSALPALLGLAPVKVLRRRDRKHVSGKPLGARRRHQAARHTAKDARRKADLGSRRAGHVLRHPGAEVPVTGQFAMFADFSRPLDDALLPCPGPRDGLRGVPGEPDAGGAPSAFVPRPRTGRRTARTDPEQARLPDAGRRRACRVPGRAPGRAPDTGSKVGGDPTRRRKAPP